MIFRRMKFIMKFKKIKKILLPASGVLILFCLWDLFSLALQNQYGTDFALPGVRKTMGALFRLMAEKEYWKVITLSVFRIFEGLLIGTAAGVIISVFCYYCKSAEAILKPFMTVIRSTPVVSFILILWVVLENGKNLVPSLIAALMVTPVVYGQMQAGFSTLDKNNMEMLSLYGITGIRKLRDFILPSLLPHFFTAILTCVGLAWKAGVSAEVIVYAKDSVGMKISDAKAFGETPQLFAWTLSVILFSVLFERIILKLKKEVGKREH